MNIPFRYVLDKQVVLVPKEVSKLSKELAKGIIFAPTLLLLTRNSNFSGRGSANMTVFSTICISLEAD